MPYTFLLSRLNGTGVSESPGATSKRIDIPVVGMATSSLTVRGDSPDADFLLEGDALLRVYEHADDNTGRVLLGHHRLVTAEEVAEDGRHTVAATFADPFWTLLRRLIGKYVTVKSAEMTAAPAGGFNYPAGYSRGSAGALVDRGTIISELLAEANADGNTGVSMGTLTASSSTFVAGWFFKPLGEAIAELCATLDGPDWRIRPQEYAAGRYGLLDVVPTIGTHKPLAAFEYGDGRLNVRGYRRLVTLEHIANRVYSLPAGFPDNAIGATIGQSDTASQAIRGKLEAVIPSDLTIDSLRTGLLAAHLAARRAPRQTIGITPTRDIGGRVPRLGVDFNVGDTFPFRATVRRGATLTKRINVTARLYSYGVTVDELGAGTPTLTISPT